MNLGTKAAPQIIHLVQSLTAKEKEEFTSFFQRKKINFAWPYSDMPGLDPNLIMHHLSIATSIKPIK